MTDPLPGASRRDYDCILKQSVPRAAEAATVQKPCVLGSRCACSSYKRLLQRKQLEGGLALKGLKGNSAAETLEETYGFLSVKTSHPPRSIHDSFSSQIRANHLVLVRGFYFPKI